MRTVDFRRPDEFERDAAAIAAHLRAGGLIAYPTETVYGLGCALHEPALASLSRLKRRDPAKPFLLLVLDAGQTPGLTWTDSARALAGSRAALAHQGTPAGTRVRGAGAPNSARY